MKVQEVLRALAKKIPWWQAAAIIGISDRSLRRWRVRLKEFGYDGLFDRRRGRRSPKRVPLATVEQVLGLYRDRHFDLNGQHFHEKLSQQHGIQLRRDRVYLGTVPSKSGYSASVELLATRPGEAQSGRMRTPWKGSIG